MNALTTVAAAALLSLSLATRAEPLTVESLDRMAQDEAATQRVYRVHFPDEDMAAKAAISFEGSLLKTNYAERYLVLELSPRELKKLRALNLRIEPDTAYMAERSATLAALRRAGMPTILGQAAAEPGTVESIPSFPCYETVEESFAAAEGFTQTHPQLAEWTDIGDSWQKANGGGGFDMMVLKLTNKLTTGVGGEAKPRLLITSAIHAREYVTAPLALAFARQLLQGYGTDADSTWLLDHHEVHFLLQHNPDGRKIAEKGLSKRKNDNTQFCSQSGETYRGVDLNRNFAFTWNALKDQGSSPYPCDEDFRGPSAGSEPEVQAMQDYAKQLWPDRRGPKYNNPAPADTSGLHIDLHSYSELVLWPWGSSVSQAPNHTQLQTLGRKFSFHNNYKAMQSIGLYPTDGTAEAATYGELGVASYTFEMGTEFMQRCGVYEKRIKPQNLAALLYAAKVARTPYITPAGPDVLQLTLDGQAATTGVKAGTKVALTAQADDTRYGTRSPGGVEPTQAIAAAQAYIDTPPWVPGAKPVALQAADGQFDTATEGLKATLRTAGLTPGKHMVYVRAKDAAGNWGAVSASFLVIR